MRNILKLNSIRKKFIIPIVLIAIPIFFISGFIIFRVNNYKMEEEIKIQLDAIQNNIDTNINRIAKKALWIATGMSAIQGVEQAYLMKNENEGRSLLRKLTRPFYQTLRKNLHLSFIKIHYHKPPAKSFLRLWRKPGQKDGGDDISAFRNTILDISKNHKPITTVEVGRGGLVIRGIAPIIRNNKYYGSVEVLFDFYSLYKFLGEKENIIVCLENNIARIINESKAKVKDKRAFTFNIGDEVFISSSKNELSKNIQTLNLKSKNLVQINHSFYKIGALKDYKNNRIGSIIYFYNAKSKIQSFARIRVMISSIILFVFIIIIFLVWIFGTRMKKSIDTIALSIKDLSEGEGDLTKRVPAHEEDEIGKLGLWVNMFVEKIQAVVIDISKSTKEVLNSAETLQVSSKNLNSQTENIAKESTNVSNLSESMKDNLLTITSAIEEMSITISEIASTTVKTEEVANTANQTSSKTNEIVLELNDNAQKINKVIESISDIADQTNLLALNASIEAAGAGEAGKGFAVVASEVKELAKEASISSDDIKQRIGHITLNSESTMNAMTDLKKIIQNLNEYTTAIASAIEEQSITSREISSNLNSTLSNSKEVSNAMVEIDNLSRINVEESDKLNHLAEQMKNTADMLNNIVGLFKV